MDNITYEYELEFTVRDYECDLQGIVNNAVYLNYLEHTRHQFLLAQKIDFADLHTKGIDLVVSRIEIDYKFSLSSDDKFVVKLNTCREGNLRMIFEQDIYKFSDNRLVVHARVIGVGLKNGRPIKTIDIPGFNGLGKYIN